MSAGFRELDVDGDGLLGSGDIDLLIENHGTAYGFPEDSPEYEELTERTMAVWHRLKQFDSDDDGLVTLDEYIAGFEEFLSDRDAFMGSMTALVDAFFSVADRNSDGEITEDELIIHYRAWNHSDEQAREAFRRLDRNGNGAISKEEWMANLEEYYFSEDPEAPGTWLAPLPEA
ncbi:MAG TPA: EF-hand domain-containing protein [Pseudonocardiaceae bacterium]